MLVFEVAREETEFVVDSNGDCFFCLNKASSEPESVPTPHYSLQYLSRYLKLDIRKAFKGKGLIPPELLAKVGRSRLKAVLCVECASLSEQFSELFRKLEKVKMDMEFCLSRIENMLFNEEEREGMLDLDKRLEILEALRTEALQKCAMKLLAAQPRIRLPTTNQVNRLGNLHIGVRFKCDLCGEAFVRKSLLRKHRELEHAPTHNQENPFLGTLCPVNVSSEVELRPSSQDGEMGVDDLITNSAPEDETSCEDYSEMETDTHNQHQIIITVGETDIEVIRSEETIFSELFSKNDRDNPIATHSSRRKSEIQLRKADDVEKNDSSSIIISPSVDFEHIERTYECPSCEMVFNQFSSYERHRINAHTDRHKCQNCDKVFRRKFNLRKHQQICKPGKVPLSKDCCYVCGKAFSGADKLLTHMKTVHLQLREHECDLCGKKFKQRSHLTVHRRRIHREGVLQVSSSPHGIVTSGSTESHHPSQAGPDESNEMKPITIELLSSDEDQDRAPAYEATSPTPGPSGQNPASHSVKCHHCSEWFPSLSSLEQHQIAVQQKLSKFECDICHKRFLTSGECSNHRYTVHSINKDGNEKQNCDLCGKELNSLVALRKHFEVVHLKVRNFACPTCGKKFNRVSGVKQHMDSVHLKIRFPCENPGCNKICADKSVLNKHKKVCPNPIPTSCVPEGAPVLANDVEEVHDVASYVKAEQINMVESSNNLSVDEQFILPN